MVENETSSINNKSILVICNLPSYPGKVERHLNPLAMTCDNVTIVCPVAHESIDSEKMDNIKIHEVPLGSTLLSKFVELFLSFYICLKGDFDAIVTVSLVPHGIYGLLVGTVCRVPTHLRIIGCDIPNHSRSKYRILPLTLFPRFDSIAVHGSNHKKFLINNGVPECQIYIVPGSIDYENYETGEPLETEYDFLWLAGMKSHKRPEFFVQALSILRERGHDFRAVMVGGGPIEETVDQIVRSEGLSDAIDRPGWVDVEKTPRYYASSSIFVLTSEREALGYPLVEAMASGLACVAPDYSELADGNTSFIVSHMEDGILVPEMSPETLADNLELLLTDEKLRERLSARAAKSSRRFSQEKMKVNWDAVIEDLA